MQYMLREKIHPVWHIGCFAGGVIAGVVAAYFFHSTAIFLHGLWIVVAVVCFGMVVVLRMRALLILVVVAGVLLGFVRGNNEMVQRQHTMQLIGRSLQITGTVVDDVSVLRGNDISIQLKDVTVEGVSQTGTFWVSLSKPHNQDIKRSDRVVLRGKLTEGFGVFVATMYRAEIISLKREPAKEPFLRFRDWFADAIRSVIDEPESALGIGYILGQKRALPNDLTESLRVVALTHVVVASGYNLTILVRFARRFGMKISRFSALILALGLVFAFIGVTGASPSMVRAGFVAVLSLLAWYYGRVIHPLILLIITAAISLLISPSYAWGDVGWMLSFAAFFGVLIVAPMLQAYFYGDKKPGVVRQIVGETLSAQLLTAPLIMLMFGSFSTVALLANMLVLPLVPLAMALTFLTGVGAVLFTPLGELLALPATWLLWYMVQVAKKLSAFDWASIEVSVGPLTCVALYSVLVLVCVFLARKTKSVVANHTIIE